MKTWALLIVLSLFANVGHASSAIRIDFDDWKPGELPDRWRADATHSGKKLAEWSIVSDTEAPTKPHVLSLTKPSDSEFNLFWTDSIRFKNGTIEAKIRADGGKEDQGGGLVWRMLDANNYYVTRYNPLEKNLRLYYVKQGRRVQLADVQADIKSGGWFKIAVLHQEDVITVFFNGQKLIVVKDSHFLDSGGVGLWTKADATSSFDDFVVQA